jgi:hypothetical protein
MFNVSHRDQPMTYLKVIWKHEENEYPTILYSELDNNRYEVRKVDVYHDGSMSCACETESSGDTMLGCAPTPHINEINADFEFEAFEISEEEFETIWKKAIKK